MKPDFIKYFDLFFKQSNALFFCLLMACYSQNKMDGKVTEDSDQVKGKVNLADYEIVVSPEEKGGYKIAINAPDSVVIERFCLMSKGLGFQNVIDSLIFDLPVSATSSNIIKLNWITGHLTALEFDVDQIDAYWDGEVVYNLFKPHFDKIDNLTLVHAAGFNRKTGFYLIKDGSHEITFDLSAKDSCYADTTETMGGEVEPYYLTEGTLSQKIIADFKGGKSEVE